MSEILVASIVKSPNGMFHRVIVKDDYTVKVFVTNEDGSSKNFGPILVEEMKGKTNLSKLGKAMYRHNEIVLDFIKGKMI